MGKIILSGVVSASLLLAACSEDNGNISAVNGDEGIFGSNVTDSDSVAVPCEGGGIATNDEVTVSRSVDLRARASGDADKIVNKRATEILNETYYHQVDQTTSLREICRTAEWSKVQIMEPEWLTNVVGWVPVKELRQIERDVSGKRTYVESDFVWDEETENYKAQLVTNVNKIIRENASCQSIDPGTLSRSGNRGTPSNPVFFVACNNDAGPFNVWFEPGDAAAGRVFRAAQNIGKTEATIACEQTAKQAANNPQTVDFSRFVDVAFVPYPNGNSRLLSTFTAKNAFGVETKFRIECFFEGGSLTERSIAETIA